MSTRTPLEHLEMLQPDRTNPVYQRFKTLGLPGNKSEQYRSFGIKPILAAEYSYTPQKESNVKTTADTLCIENGILIARPENVTVSVRNDCDISRDHFDALYYLGHLLSPRTIVIHADEDADLLLHHHIDQQQHLLAYRIVLEVAPGCRVTCTESFETKGSERALLLYGLDITVAQNGTLHWVRSQSSADNETVIIGSHHYDLKAQSTLRLQTFDFGSGNGLHLYDTDLAEETHAQLDHLLFASQHAHRGNVIRLNHKGRHITSRHNAKSILTDSATGIFDGLIHVGPHGAYANTRQNSKAILLSDGAFMKAKPQLEIYTDELEASHGATTGQLDEAALFYLRSRGISKSEARKMLILAFAEEMIDALANEHTAKTVRQTFESSYYSTSEKEIS